MQLFCKQLFSTYSSTAVGSEAKMIDKPKYYY